jgi:cytosine/adenosine deaminase-related metal-dependent hydrolase
MARGWGPIAVQGFIDHGIRPGLGIDDQQFAPGDMFAQMRAIISLQHATAFDLKLAGKAGIPQLLGTREVIRYATSDGARAVGLGSVTGSLESGKRADLIMLRTDRPNIAPVNDPIGAVVWGMDTSNLDSVMVQGAFVMREGKLIADTTRARELAKAAAGRVSVPSGVVR